MVKEMVKEFVMKLAERQAKLYQEIVFIDEIMGIERSLEGLPLSVGIYSHRLPIRSIWMVWHGGDPAKEQVVEVMERLPVSHLHEEYVSPKWKNTIYPTEIEVPSEPSFTPTGVKRKYKLRLQKNQGYMAGELTWVTWNAGNPTLVTTVIPYGIHIYQKEISRSRVETKYRCFAGLGEGRYLNPHTVYSTPSWERTITALGGVKGETPYPMEILALVDGIT